MKPGVQDRLKVLSARLSKLRDEALLSRHKPLARLIETLPVFKRLGVNESLFFLRQHWPHVVGVALARHSTPLSLKDGVLKVGTDSPLYKQELSYAMPRILTIAQDHLGKELVREVKAAR